MSNDLAALRDGIAEMRLTLPAGAAETLIAYRDLLVKWNHVYNLTAIKTPEEILTHHLLDSLAILPWLDRVLADAAPPSAASLLDAGSGGGLPGLALAIARPELPVTLVDAVQKKTAFLRQAAVELSLKNLTVHHARVESLQGQYAAITARAFAGLADFVVLTRHLLAPNGHWLAMKGQKPDAELAVLPAWVQVRDTQTLAVPGLDAERRLVICTAKSKNPLFAG